MNQNCHSERSEESAFRISHFQFRISPFPTLLPPPTQSSPTPSNTPPPSPAAPAHTPPKPHPESPAHSSSHPQNSKPHTHTLPHSPKSPHNSTISALRSPPPSHAPQNSRTQTPPAAPWDFHSAETLANHQGSSHAAARQNSQQQYKRILDTGLRIGAGRMFRLSMEAHWCSLRPLARTRDDPGGTRILHENQSTAPPSLGPEPLAYHALAKPVPSSQISCPKNSSPKNTR